LRYSQCHCNTHASVECIGMDEINAQPKIKIKNKC
jgi:hypothetical protein